MALKEIEMRLHCHPLFEQEIPIQMQLGLPCLYQKNGHLFLHYFLHKRQYENGMLLIYPNQYEVELAYPFQYIVRFENFQVYMPKNTEIPVCIVEAERLLAEGESLLDELYSSADQVIEYWVQDRKFVDESLLCCRNIREKIVKIFSLDSLYGG